MRCELEDKKVIYLSPSTQEGNIGVLNYGSEEYRMNEIADLIEVKLKDKGYIVYRNKEEYTLRQIIDESNELKPDIHVAIHSNAFLDGSVSGPEVFVNGPNTRGEILAKLIYEEILNVYYDKSLGRGVKYTEELNEVTDVNATSVLVEIAFHDNIADANWIIENKNKIADAIVEGIEKYFNMI